MNTWGIERLLPSATPIFIVRLACRSIAILSMGVSTTLWGAQNRSTVGRVFNPTINDAGLKTRPTEVLCTLFMSLPT